MIHNMQIITVAFHHEDRGNAKTIFKGVGDYSRKWFSLSHNGEWSSVCASGGYYEETDSYAPPTIFLIKNEGEGIFAIESNITDYKIKPFISPSQFCEKLTEKYLQLDGAMSYNEWAQWSKDCEAFDAFKGYKDVFLFGKAHEISTETLETVEYLGVKYSICKATYQHQLSGKIYAEIYIEPKAKKATPFYLNIEQSLGVYIPIKD